MIDSDELAQLSSRQPTNLITTTEGHTVHWVLPLADQDGGYVVCVDNIYQEGKGVHVVGASGLGEIELVKIQNPPKVHELKAYIPVYEGPGNDIWLGPSAPTLERARARQSAVGKLIAVLPADLKFKEGDNLE